jgi:hypothetical protein
VVVREGGGGGEGRDCDGGGEEVEGGLNQGNEEGGREGGKNII